VKGIIPVVIIAAVGVVIFEAHNLLEYYSCSCIYSMKSNAI